MNKKYKHRSSTTEQLAIFLLAILLVSAFLVIISIHNSITTAYKAANVVIYFITLLFAFILIVGCVLVNIENNRIKRQFEGLIILSFLSTLFSLASYLMNGTIYVEYVIAMQIIANAFLSAYWIYFWFYQSELHPRSSYSSIITVVVIGYMALYILFSLLNFKLPIFFRITATNKIAFRTDYFTLTYFLVWHLFYLVYIFTRKCSMRVKTTLASYVALPMVLGLVSMIIGTNRIYMELYYALNSLCFLIPLYLIYFNLHIESSRQLYEQREELTAARINLMVSQIQPHFIYNSLTAIIGLIDIDKEQAKKSIVSFSDYLRVNLNSLTDTTLIPFDKELEHSRTYLDFELLRFKNISVEYDIQTTDFKLPALTVQPLLENAIKHGVTKTGHGGTVSLSVQDQDKYVEIIIADNGVGFDTDAKRTADHVGIENVRKRLQNMCNGDLKITSEIGIGTTVVVSIPKEDNLQ